MHHHRGSSGGGAQSSAPPAPLLSSRSSRGPPPSSRARSRSRSRSPRGSSSRYHSSRSERDSRDARERSDRDRDRDRERRRSRSPSPYRSTSRSDRDRDRDTRDRKPGSSSKPSSSASDALPSISLIQPEPPAPSIIRRILNPDDVKIPRRVNEGAKAIFDREELREAMIRRMRANDNEENPPQANTYIQEGNAPQQRVVAIIREPIGGADMYLSSASKEPSFHHHAVASSKMSSGTSTGHSQRASPGPPPSRSSYQRRSPSPPPRQSSRDREMRPTNRHQSPVRMPSLPRGRSPERDRVILDRERDREQLQRAMERERELNMRAGGRERLPLERERERDLRDIRTDRDRELHSRDSRGDRDHRDPHPRDIRPLPGDRDRAPEREKGSRFSGGPPGPSHHPAPPHGLATSNNLRGRSRSPISRVPREDMRIRRRSRSHSVTPPPMPEDFRRQIIDRQRHVDLRTSLSRQPGKFPPGHDDRVNKRPGPPVRGGMGGRGRGGFPGRAGRGREDERRVWVHDMYDGDEEPKKGD